MPNKTLLPNFVCLPSTLERELNNSIPIQKVNYQIIKLYKEPAPENVRADLMDEGIKTLEDAYMQGIHHGLAELKMRLAEPSNIRS